MRPKAARLLTSLSTAALLAAGAAVAQTHTVWSGDGDWFADAGNWSHGEPGPGDVAVVQSGTVTLTNATPALAAFTNQAGVVAFSNWWARLEAAEVSLAGGTLRPAAAFTNAPAMSNRVWIVCSNLTVGSSAVIHADGLGYAGILGAPGSGPGGGRNGGRSGGGGHGGTGGTGSTSGGAGGEAYGDAVYPTTPGSAAGASSSGTAAPGRNGGGAIRIDAAGRVTLNGRISADGIAGNSYTGAGAGGGILIQCHTLQGGGILRADGGNVSTLGGGEGGGGRIAVHYDTEAQALLSLPTLTVSVSAGKRNHLTGSAFGSLYFSDTRLLSAAVSNLRGWLHIPGFASWTPASLTLTNAYLGFPTTGFELAVAGNVGGSGDRMLAFRSNSVVTVGGDLDAAIDFPNGGACNVGGDLTLRAVTWNNYHSRTVEADLSVGGSLLLDGVWRLTSAPTNGIASYGSLVDVGGDLTLASTALLYLHSNPTNGGSALLRTTNFMLAEGAIINADASGFVGVLNMDGLGPGGGGRGNNRAAGGGFGGRGGAGIVSSAPAGTPGPSNGWAYAPLGPGSAGGGRSTQPGDTGGGLVRIEARGAAQVNGTITANGARVANYAGKGSGGGIFIRAVTFAGGSNAVMRATGGALGAQGGGVGGGGRITVWHGEIDDAAAALILAGQHADLGARFLAASDLSTFAGKTEVFKGADDPWDGTENGGTDGTVFFVKVLPPPGTVLLLR